eukprot:NODE_124_length_18806_cov_0.323996.p10 type:complete len:216 gc:universal NODE_124_length_18806_cov_0.323996:4825-5472(+)
MFARSTADWMNSNGPFKYLHKLNDIRIPYISNIMKISGKKVLDVGAGGGILSTELLKMGANVTSIDLEPSNLSVMREVKDLMKLNNWEIKNENIFDINDKYDIVIASEVIEHVDEQHAFLSRCCELTKKNGAFVLSTINKTLLSHFITITLAENLLGKIDKGTHDSRLYVCPEDVNVKGYSLSNVKPFILNPLSDNFVHIEFPTIHWIGCMTHNS